MPFVVTIAGKAHGVIDLTVDYGAFRESDQGNHVVVLHWGESLGAVLRGTNYAGHVLTLERLSDGTYRLDIAP